MQFMFIFIASNLNKGHFKALYIAKFSTLQNISVYIYYYNEITSWLVAWFGKS